MSPTIVVRVATPSDNAVIEGHLKLARQESSTYRGRPAVTRAATDSYVAAVGDTVFGSLGVARESDGTATVTHVFVEKEAREIGIGDSLLSFVMNDLAARNITYLAASAQPGDRSLKNLYERHGLVAQTILVGRSLSDPSTEEHASR